MTETETDRYQLDAIDADGRGVRLEFYRENDRYRHRLLFIDGDRVIEVARSVEGTDVVVWPKSPPLQQLSLENQQGSKEVALGVGMAGRSHWSLAVDAFTDPPSLRFEAACRFNERPELLGSTYELLGNEQQWSIAHDLSCVRSDGGIVIKPSDATCGLVVEDHQCRLNAGTDSSQFPETIAWSYQVCFGS